MAEQKLSVRDQRQRDLMERMRMAQAVPRVRVLPRDENVRANIKHQPTLIGFPETGSVEWPDDAFTRRRIADGDVTVEQSAPGSPEAPKQNTDVPSSGQEG